MRVLVTTILLTAAFAGCLGAKDDPVTGEGGTDGSGMASASSTWGTDAIFGKGVDPVALDWIDMSDAHREVHNHSLRDDHIGLTTPNFEVVGWDPMMTDFHGQTAGGYFCGEVSTEGERKYAVVNSFTSSVAVAVVDVTDPLNPMMVGELVLENSHVYDSAVTADGSFALLALNPTEPAGYNDAPESNSDVSNQDNGQAESAPSVSLTFRDRCGNEKPVQQAQDGVPYGSGTLLVDIRDPTNPSVADYQGSPVLGPHSVSSTRVGGVDYVASSTTNLQYDASYFQFYTVDASGEGQLIPYSTYSAQYAQSEAQRAAADDGSGGPSGATGNAPLLNGHVDATIYEHPVTGQLLGGLSNWDGGMVTIDLTPNAAGIAPTPTLISTWGSSLDASISFGGVVHSVYVVPDMRDGRFLVIAGQETGSEFGGDDFHRPTGQIVILDMTDPASPEPLARWTLPFELYWSGGLHFSTHYFTVVGDTLFTAMYHGGVWAADMSQDQWPELPSIGVWVPDNQPPGGERTRFSFYSPTVLDVLALEDGSLVSFDAESGAYTLRFNPDDASVPRLDPWMSDAWIGE